ncbi:MAG: glycosyltransferase family 2 protein [Okeania sp. SIO3I5]|uniref:glycosyltransferase family 2 protein n=1 Tax=Okeania sp. SIO3I5 TaxID=2607805 RepID=UPI0013B8F193|nr:glycosyltransferase family 2 protein [Okeania sp. SIO3I5]NEQ38356.1 glycosyltransferase family 2 protein [Okeania sp. SIO3I5]
MSNFEEKESVYIIIPVHNRKHLTLGCLENLTKTGDRQKYHIVVIDDGSTDGTTEEINAQYPDVIVLPGDGDLWWTGAITTGMEYAYEKGAEYFIWLNDDSLPEVNTLPFLIEFASKNPDTIVSPTCYNLDEKKIEDNGFRGRKTYSASPGEKIFVEGMCGWCTVIPRSVFSKIGPPNAKRFPQYSGDDTYTLKATRSGFKACILGDVKVNLVGPVRQVHKVKNYIKPNVTPVAAFKSLFWTKKSPYYMPSRFFYHTEKYGNVLGSLLFGVKIARWMIELTSNFLRENK